MWVRVPEPASAAAFVCARLCLAGLRRGPRSAASRLVVGTGGRPACVRLRGLCLSTCLGWVSVGYVCALRARSCPHSLLPCCPLLSPYLASNFSPGSSGNACWQPSSLSPPEVLRAAKGWGRIGGLGVIGSAWRLAPARAGRSVLDTLTGPQWEEAGDAAGLGSGLRLETRESRAAGSPLLCVSGTE